MKNVILLVAAVSIVTRADGRVYYLENLDGPNLVRGNDAIYPIVEQQASRDLDLSFSAEDPAENEIVSPTKKVYTFVAPERPYIELNRDADRPYAYYKVAEPATRRSSFDDVVLVPVPQGGRKLMKLNGNNKGEVILELRVLANHDSA
ncbi:hypothetical protein DMN91_010602 [Ooceraea biroi]|uniref:DUF4794 domain-containing protein n=1 Tax=Ooceraea biroi TaxID=2015173 RepID=A0A026WYU3_OOCBI|nr:uncharacterized protein LOC105274462 [Ooceraea biroi]EZA60314.1 hypothetical protein X777_13403 [Ooceraea biroi]RLU16534.1 hypothetical protein DMN91_010602 [Ooceraea biroi]